MLFKSIVTSDAGIVYVADVAFVIALLASSVGFSAPAWSVLYHWYVNVPAPDLVTVKLTWLFFSTALTSIGFVIVPASPIVSNALFDIAVVVPSFGVPYFCVATT